MRIPHPIPYQGSKRKLAQTIMNYIPEGTSRLFEPFAGSAAVTLAAAYYGKAASFFINDSNAPLMTLWSNIIERPEEIAEAYGELWEAQLGRERQYYDVVRRRFNETHEPHYLLYLLARCVKAAIRYNSKGEFNQSPDNRRKGSRPTTMRAHIVGASSQLYGRTIVTDGWDYRKALEQVTPEDVVYMDPPYQGVLRNRDPRYKEGLAYEEFLVTLRDLNARSVPYLVSYDGRTGSKVFGNPLPDDLELEHIEIAAGRSSQATLLGRSDETVESLYLSPALTAHSGFQGTSEVERAPALFEDGTWLKGSTLLNS